MCIRGSPSQCRSPRGPTTAGGQRSPAPQRGGAVAPFTDTYGIEVETPSCVFVGCGSGPSVMERHAMNGPPSSIHRLIPGSSLRDTVESSLSAAIVSGELAPGTLVSVPTLAAQFGVSATPVREAMLDLEKRGFVQPVRNKGCLVTNVSEQDLPDIVQVRRWLEGPAMRIAAEKLEGRSVGKYRRARARPATRPRAPIFTSTLRSMRTSTWRFSN